MHEETFAATNFTTKSFHEWTKWLSMVAWLARGLADLAGWLALINIHDARLHWTKVISVVCIVAKQL